MLPPSLDRWLVAGSAESVQGFLLRMVPRHLGQQVLHRTFRTSPTVQSRPLDLRRLHPRCPTVPPARPHLQSPPFKEIQYRIRPVLRRRGTGTSKAGDIGPCCASTNTMHCWPAAEGQSLCLHPMIGMMSSVLVEDDAPSMISSEGCRPHGPPMALPSPTR